MRVNVPKEQAQRGVLEAGTYGEGQEHNAVVELIQFEYPAESRLPNWDKNNERGPWGLFTVRILTEDGQQHLLTKFVESPDLKRTLISVGVTTDPTGDGGFDFENDDVANRKIRGVELKEAREGNQGFFPNEIKQFIS